LPGIVLLTALVMGNLIGPVAHTGYVPPNNPTLLSFEELIALYQIEIPPLPLAKKLEELLASPFVENRTGADQPAREQAASTNSGQRLRIAHWNIKRGLRVRC
jgi:hypothetical protein